MIRQFRLLQAETRADSQAIGESFLEGLDQLTTYYQFLSSLILS
ncbi:MAG: hypothetical protein BMS9Abin02_1916 [Anaerolineae bacterium]|nr:MAG: hypothetical protein BMS9Abin02_1916 [Anaerolineae bacterium]